MSKNLQKTIEDYSHELWHNQNFDIVTEICEPNIIVESSFRKTKGTQALIDVAKKWLTAFPDMKPKLQVSVVEKNKIACQYKTTGTHLGEFLEIPATGKIVEYCGVTIYTFNEKNKIIHYWALIDLLSIKKQIEAKN